MSFLPGHFPAGATAGVVEEPATFPVVEGRNSDSFSSGSGPFAVSLPAGIEAGDVLLLYIFTGTADVPNTPSGWTRLFDQGGGQPNFQVTLFYKVADGSEGSSVNVSFNDDTALKTHTYRISGSSGEVESNSVDNGSGGIPNPPNLSPSWGSTKTLWVVHGGGEYTFSDMEFSSAPPNYSNLYSPDSGIATATRAFESVSDDPGEFTESGSGSRLAGNASTTAIRPA